MTIFFHILSNMPFDPAYCALLRATWHWTSEQIQAELTTWTVPQSLLFTGQHVNPAGNAMDAHVQDFLVNDLLNLGSIYTVHSLTGVSSEVLDVLSLYVVQNWLSLSQKTFQ